MARVSMFVFSYHPISSWSENWNNDFRLCVSERREVHVLIEHGNRIRRGIRGTAQWERRGTLNSPHLPYNPCRCLPFRIQVRLRAVERAASERFGSASPMA